MKISSLSTELLPQISEVVIFGRVLIHFSDDFDMNETGSRQYLYGQEVALAVHGSFKITSFSNTIIHHQIQSIIMKFQ